MTKLLLKLFVKDTNTHSPAVRARVGSLSGIVGICANILLFAAKLFIGIISGSLSITADAMKIEISRAYKRRKAAERKRQEQQDLDVLGKVQPKERGLRYDNTSSAVAEEVLLTMLLKEPALLPDAKLLPETFSSPLLGRAFGLVKQLAEEGRPVTLASMSGEFTQDEMNHLSQVVRNRDQLVSDAVVRDCAAKIREEYEKTLRSGADALMARYAQLKTKKGYGG